MIDCKIWLGIFNQMQLDLEVVKEIHSEKLRFYEIEQSIIFLRFKEGFEASKKSK